MMPVHLRIKPALEDLLCGEGGQPGRCALANYIRRSYPRFTHVGVTGRYVALSDPEDRLRYKFAMPMTAISWIDRFDRWKDGKGAAPGEVLDFYLRREESIAAPMSTKPTPAERQRRRDAAEARKKARATETAAERTAREKRNAVRRNQRRKGVA